MNLTIAVLDTHPDIIKRLKNAKISKLEDIVLKPTTELQREAKLSKPHVEALRSQACSLIYPFKALSVLDCLKSSYAKLPIGCDAIDNALNGGVLCQGITELSGDSSAGKTQICMQLALNSQLIRRNGKLCNCLYICTEDVFPTQRLLQLERSVKQYNPSLANHKFTDHVFIEHLSDKDQLLATLENRVPSLLARGLTNLLIIDSVTAVFRGQETDQALTSRARDISAIGVQLHRLSEKYKIAVFCVNQVTADMREHNSCGQSLPALGLTWSNLVTTRLQVRRLHPESPIRQLAVAFAPHLHNNYCEYKITQDGVVSS